MNETWWNRVKNEGLFATLWSLLPDKCEVPQRYTYWQCPRKGMRGNENRIPMPNGEVWVMCDDCTTHWDHIRKGTVQYEQQRP